jgi:hypothetical protein
MLWNATSSGRSPRQRQGCGWQATSRGAKDAAAGLARVTPRQEIGPPREMDKAIPVRLRMRKNSENPRLRFPPVRGYRLATVQPHGLLSR